MTFQDFLKQKAADEKEHKRRKRRAEWRAAVERLLDQIRAWLAESDPERILDVTPDQAERWEPGLGYCSLPTLTIEVGSDTIRVEPMGRHALGIVELPSGAVLKAEGRVDITAGARKYILYRTIADDKETWYALDEKFAPTRLDRGRLEAIVQDLLS
jgi:hypothetical protein